MHCILFIWAKPLVFSHLSVVLKSKCCTIPLNRYLCLTHILCMPFHHFLEHSNSVKKICKNAVQYVLHFKMKKVFPYFFNSASNLTICFLIIQPAIMHCFPFISIKCKNLLNLFAETRWNLCDTYHTSVFIVLKCNEDFTNQSTLSPVKQNNSTRCVTKL